VYNVGNLIHIEVAVRTNIDLDDALVERAMAATGLRTKKGVIEEALRRLLRAYEQRQAIEDLRGLGWEGDLDEMRAPRDLGL
jgi:Arc/MetJ family transcription regulator